MATIQVVFIWLLGHHGVVTGTRILAAGTMVAHLVVVIAGMVLDNGILVASLADEMGEIAKNRDAKGSPTTVGMVAAVSLVVLRVANELLITARGHAKEGREGSSEASHGHADHVPNWHDKGVHEGTQDPRGASNVLLPLVTGGRATGSGRSSYGSGSCMMVAAVPSG